MGIALALAGLGRVGAGYAQGLDQYQQRQLREKADQRAQEDHDVSMAQAKRREDEQISLANAAKPAVVEPNVTNDDDGNPSSAPPYRMSAPGLSQVQTFGDQASANTAASSYNTDDATNQRIGLAYRTSGDPAAGLRYGTAAMQAKQTLQEFADKKHKQDLGAAIAGGHSAIADFITSHQGDQLATHKVQAVPSDDGKNVTYNKVGDDGKLTPIPNLTFSNDEEGAIRAGYMLDKFVDPQTRYTNMISEEKTQAAMKAKVQELELRQRMLEEVQKPTAEARVQLAEVKAQLATLREQAGGGNVSREERLRYTTLFTDSGRRMQDAQKAINTMRGDRSFMKRASVVGSTEAQQLADVQGQLKQYSEERETWRGLLSPGASSSAAAPAPAAAAAPDAPKRVTSQAERDALPKGSRYIAPDGNKYIKQ